MPRRLLPRKEIMTYERTVAAAVAESKSKFALAEALAEDIPPRGSGPNASGQPDVKDLLAEAAEAIIRVGGEPHSVSTLDKYRQTALWAKKPNSALYRWVPRSSFSAHLEARAVGISYEEFAALPKKTVDAIRLEVGRQPKSGSVSRIGSWTPEQRTEAARELLADPLVAKSVEDAIVEHVASDPVRTAHVISKRREVAPEPAPVVQDERPKRDYDAMVEQWVNLASVTFAAESAGTWKPNEHSEALLYFISQIIGKRSEPTGEKADFINEKLENLFSEVEAYANSEVS